MPVSWEQNIFDWFQLLINQSFPTPDKNRRVYCSMEVYMKATERLYSCFSVDFLNF